MDTRRLLMALFVDTEVAVQRLSRLLPLVEHKLLASQDRVLVVGLAVAAVAWHIED
jgi:hypothetical protein